MGVVVLEWVAVMHHGKKSWKQLVQCDSKQRTTKTRTVIQGCM